MSIQHLVTMSLILPSIFFSEKNIWFHIPLLTFWKRINQWPHKQRLLVRTNKKFMWGHTTDSFVLCTLCFVSNNTKCLGSWIWTWNFKAIFEAALFFVTIYFDGISEKNLIYFNIFDHPKKFVQNCFKRLFSSQDSVTTKEFQQFAPKAEISDILIQRRGAYLMGSVIASWGQ